MKKSFLFLFIISQCFISTGQDAPNTQLRFHAGLTLGLNGTQVDGDDYAGYHKLGINGGFLAELPLSRKFFISTEILYSQKGSKSRTYQGIPVAYRLKLNYAEIPVLINFQEKTAVNFGVGVAYARLIKTREFLDDLEQDPFEEFERSEFSGIVNGNYILTKHFRFNARFAYSFLAIGHSPVSNFVTRSMFNNMFTFRFAYVL